MYYDDCFTNEEILTRLEELRKDPAVDKMGITREAMKRRSELSAMNDSDSSIVKLNKLNIEKETLYSNLPHDVSNLNSNRIVFTGNKFII